MTNLTSKSKWSLHAILNRLLSNLKVALNNRTLNLMPLGQEENMCRNSWQTRPILASAFYT